MQQLLPPIHTEKEIHRITAFLKRTLAKQHVPHVVLGVSGGIDSATTLFLLLKVIPKESIHLLHMPYFQEDKDAIRLLSNSGVPKQNSHVLSIRPSVDALAQILQVKKNNTIRLANVMARVRMITLFDYAKKANALVVGTENKSEHLLGYFTRFGDAASDIEPIQHLYKTHVYQLAKQLEVPKSIQKKQPSAGLWHHQADEKEFGFTYKEADQVLHLYFDKKIRVEDIMQQGFRNAEKIIARAEANAFKHAVPYVFEER